MAVAPAMARSLARLLARVPCATPVPAAAPGARCMATANAGWVPVPPTPTTLAAQTQRFGEAGRPTRDLAVLHGLFGSGRNWRAVGAALGNALVQHDPDYAWRITLVDQRCHGASTRAYHAEPPHTLQSSALDLDALFGSLMGGAPDVLIGHSLGGKVALAYLATELKREAIYRSPNGKNPPKCTFVLDSAPWRLSNDFHGTKSTMDVLRDLPEVIPSRRWLHDTLGPQGLSADIINWLGTNLAPLPGQSAPEPLFWQWDFQGCESMFQSYADTDHWSTLHDAHHAGLTAEVVVAERSYNAWPDAERHKLSAAPVHHVLPRAGHWLHVDNPSGLVHLLAGRIHGAFARLPPPLQ